MNRTRRVSMMTGVVIVVVAATAASVNPASAAAATATPAARNALTSSGGSPPIPANVPYSLPVQLPQAKNSPAVDASAPYTPAVLSLIAQLEPGNPPTLAQLTNASTILHGGTNATCHNVGPTGAPTGTTPSIMPPCWTDAQGVNVTSGPNVRNTTAPADLMSLGASFDLSLANAWGQTEGTEARELMVSGLFGPQADVDRQPEWGRNLSTTGADPYLSGQMVAAQVNGVQGAGVMSQLKHFAAYNGINENVPVKVQDQALHETYLPTYEAGFVGGRGSATMCSYSMWQDTAAPSSSVPALAGTYPLSPYATSGQQPQTSPLNEMHYACEQPLTLTYALRDLWGSVAMVGSDYPSTHSTSSISQGEDQEQPTSSGYFSASNSLSTTSSGGFGGPPSAYDQTGDTCADAAGNAQSCTAPGAVHVAGIPGPGCPAYGCTLVQAVANGTVPLSVFNQALATVLYQEQRFGMLGCDQSPVAATCTNPGGIGGDRAGTAALPSGPAEGAAPAADLGTKNGDAAISERMAEEGAVLLKNDHDALPITAGDLKGGVLVTGPGAQYTIADPTSEAAIGYADRDAIDPLQQLQSFSGDPGAFTYVPAIDPEGEAVPSAALSDSTGSVSGHLDRTSGPGAPATDSTLDFTTASGHGQLAPGNYTWSGYVYVPAADTYTFDFQFSSALTSSDVTFSFNGNQQTLQTAAPVNSTGGTNVAIKGSPTNAGYTQAGLVNMQVPAGSLAGGQYYPVTITFDNTTSASASFRFAYSRSNGDISDAAAAARGKKLAVVFLNDNGAPPEQPALTPLAEIPNPYGSNPAQIAAVEHLPDNQVQLLNAVAAANPNTVAVLNSTDPVLMPWIGNVKSVLEMWYSGEEGGTATARLLLGQADPSGHLTLTFPAHATDTIWAYDQTKPLYPGDTTGPHLDRLNGNGTGGCFGSTCPPGYNVADQPPTNESEGIYTDYRFFDKEGITPLFPFGWGLSYTSYSYSGLRVSRASSGGLAVSVRVTNTGRVTGTAVPQVYLGAPSSQPAGVQFAVRELSGFARVTLAPGQSRTVTMQVPLRQLQYWSPAKQRWLLAAGTRAVYAGNGDSPASLPLNATVTIPPTADVTCSDQQLSGAMISGDVNVPPGSWCDLVGTSVSGNVIIRGAGVRIVGSTVGGSLVAVGVASAADPLSAGTNVVCGSTIAGGLTITGSGAGSPWNLGSCGPDTVHGKVTLTGDARVTGSS